MATTPGGARVTQGGPRSPMEALGEPGNREETPGRPRRKPETIPVVVVVIAVIII